MTTQTVNFAAMTAAERAQFLADVRAQSRAEIQEKVDIIRAEVEFSTLTNPALQAIRAKHAVAEHTSATIAGHLMACKAIVDDNKMYNARMRKDRMFNPSRTYGFGNQIAEITGLVSGMLYSAADHYNMMYTIVPLSRDLLERTVQAVGRTPYYSEKYSVVVDGTPTDVPALLDCLTLIEDALNIQLDKSGVTQEAADTIWTTAQTRAEALMAEAQQAQALAEDLGINADAGKLNL